MDNGQIEGDMEEWEIKWFENCLENGSRAES